ncbi:MAG: MarR family winged helix-turn-helix transcriptional regulator [Candidatus Dormibacteria bacterium]
MAQDLFWGLGSGEGVLVDYRASRLNFASDRPLQMAKLAEQLLTSPSGATRIADRRVDKKLIQREVPDDNRRGVRPMLTGRGRTTLARADRAFHQSLDKAFSSAVSDDQVTSLRAILRGILEHNRAWDAERCDPSIAPTYLKEGCGKRHEI